MGTGRDGTSPADGGRARVSGDERRGQEGWRARSGTVRAAKSLAVRRAGQSGAPRGLCCSAGAPLGPLPGPLPVLRCSGPAAGRGRSRGSEAGPAPQEPPGHRGQVGASRASRVPSGAAPAPVPGRSGRGRGRRLLPSAMRAGAERGRSFAFPSVAGGRCRGPFLRERSRDPCGSGSSRSGPPCPGEGVTHRMKPLAGLFQNY